jgi:class 3 adenylate cyclase
VSGTPAPVAAWAALLTLPLAGLVVLLAVPRLDVTWENHPAHFWLVLGVAALNAVLTFATGEAARRRGDARLFLVSLSLLLSAGFLGLHALATPGVVLESANAGFVIATPVGLLLASIPAAASGFVESNESLAPAVIRRQRTWRAAAIGLLVAWAIWSLSGLPPLDRPIPAEGDTPALAGLAAVAVVLYTAAAARYVPVWLRRRRALPAAVIGAFVLLAQAMVAIAFSRNWHASWWEWHLLMLVAFGAVGLAARRQWREERFSDLYLEETLGALREVSVLFADLQGYTSYAERHGAEAATAMLNGYYGELVPAARREDGEVALIGDAVMSLFNARGDQADHAERAARTALAFQARAERVRSGHEGWPPLRAAVNSGEARVGILGAEGGRTYTATGDTVNLAARLEGQARPGEVLVGEATAELLPHADLDEVGELRVEGKERPVRAYVLRGLEPGGSLGEDRKALEKQDREGAR